MVASFPVTLREGLEEALIVGIALGILRKLGKADGSRPVWAGVISGVLASAIAGLDLNALGMAFAGRGEDL